MRISDWSSDVCSSDLFQREAVLRERKCLIWLAIALHDFVQPRHHPAHDCSPVARAAIRAAASVSPSYSSALSVSALRRDTSHGLFAPWLYGPYTSTDMFTVAKRSIISATTQPLGAAGAAFEYSANRRSTRMNT